MGQVEALSLTVDAAADDDHPHRLKDHQQARDNPLRRRLYTDGAMEVLGLELQPKAPGTVGFSHGDFRLIVQAFHDTAGDQFLSSEIVEDEFAVLAQRACDLLHRLDARAHGLPTPPVEELGGPGGRVVIPELLKGFLEKISPDGLQVVAKEIAEQEVLLGTQILTTF